MLDKASSPNASAESVLIVVTSDAHVSLQPHGRSDMRDDLTPDVAPLIRLRLLRPSHPMGYYEHFDGLPLRNGVAISAPAFRLVFKDAGINQCGAIIRAELG
jgi:hypothetical protein